MPEVAIYAKYKLCEHLAGYVDRLSALRAVGEESDSYDLATGNKKGFSHF
jgi:hypothetical protein